MRLRGSCELSNGDEIGVGDVTNIGSRECEQCAGPARSSNEFDLESVWFVDFDDGTEIAALEPMLWQITIENYGFQRGVIHLHRHLSCSRGAAEGIIRMLPSASLRLRVNRFPGCHRRRRSGRA
jgi:hypothetical protein